MSSIYMPKFDAGNRVVITGRRATVIRLGSAEETIVIRFDDCPDDEYFAHERFMSRLTTGATP
jgi:hypothetical protein